jgi:hypothetical protein
MSHTFSHSQSITSFRLQLHSVLFGSFSLATVFFNLVMMGLRVVFCVIDSIWNGTEDHIRKFSLNKMLS